MIKFSLCRFLHALYSSCQCRPGLTWDAQRMGTTRVRPHVWKGNFLTRPLLKEKFILRVEEKDGEGAVEKAVVDVVHEVTCQGRLAECLVWHPMKGHLYRFSCWRFR